MKRFFYLTALIMVVSLGFTSCSDDDNNSSSSSDLTMANVKAAVATSETDFNALFNDSDFKPTVKFISSTLPKYIKYKRANAANTPAIVVYSCIKKVLKGNLDGISDLVDSIKSSAGTYRADDSTKTWVRMADSLSVPSAAASQTRSKQLTLYFTDSDNKPCSISISTIFTDGLGAADSITISSPNQVKKILLPKVLMLKVVQNGTTLLYAKNTFEYDATTGILDGNISINMSNGYHASLALNYMDDRLDGSLSLVKSGHFIISSSFKMTGSNFIQHLLSSSNTISIDKASIFVYMQNDVTLCISSTASIQTIKDLIAAYKGHTTYTDAEKNEIATRFNRYVKRNLVVGGINAGTLTFQPRSVPTDISVFGQLDTKVTYPDGQTSMLYELFTAGERTKFVNAILVLIAKVTSLENVYSN